MVSVETELRSASTSRRRRWRWLSTYDVVVEAVANETNDDAVGNVCNSSSFIHEVFKHADATFLGRRRVGRLIRPLAREGVHAACARPGCVHTDAGIPVPFFGDRSDAEWM